MRWLFYSCILLMTTATALASHRSKRDLSYIKHLIGSKLFGTQIILVQKPELQKNEDYQLFKIKGYDNILLKVSRTPEKTKEKTQFIKEKVQDPVIVNPEIAIIGNYLGTTTQRETLLAINIAKNLLKTGAFSGARDKLVQEVEVVQFPYKDYVIKKVVKPLNDIPAEEKDHTYVPPPANSQTEGIKVLNRNKVSVLPQHYIPLVVASEVKYRPLKTKYSYKQKGETADIAFESYNNRDVIVTRTVKEPPLPQYIKLRFAEVASISSNNNRIKSVQPFGVIAEGHFVPQVNMVPGTYNYQNPSLGVQERDPSVSIPSYVMQRFPMDGKPGPSFGVADKVENVFSNNIDNPLVTVDRKPSQLSEPLTLPNFIGASRLPFDIRDHLNEPEIDKINQYINEKLNSRIKSDNGADLKVPSSHPKELEDNIIKANDKLSKYDGKDSKYTDQSAMIVTQYVHKQMNHYGKDNYTLVKVGEPSQLGQDDPVNTNIVKSTDEVPKDYIFIPPDNVDILLPNMIPKTNQKNYNSEKISSEIENDSTSEQDSLKNDPIVVFEDKSDQKLKHIMINRKGETGIQPYIGGPVF